MEVCCLHLLMDNSIYNSKEVTNNLILTQRCISNGDSSSHPAEGAPEPEITTII